MTSGYRLAPGWISEAQLVAVTYDLDVFPVQSDQDTGRAWQRPDNTSDVVSPVGEFVDALDFSRGGYGGAEFTWKLRTLTPKMVNYLFTTVFSSAYSASVTARTFNRATGEFEVYQAIAVWPDVRADADPAAAGYDNFMIKFLDGAAAPEGPDMTVSVSHVGGVSLNTNETFTITATNDGDGATYADIVVVATLHASLDFASTAASGWTIEYSTNGGGAYSSTIPAPPNSTTNVRYTRTSALNAGVAATAISLVAAPIAAGTLTLAATVTTTGDTGAGNNTATDTFEVNLVSDNQSAFAKGAAGTSDNQVAYMSGV